MVIGLGVIALALVALLTILFFAVKSVLSNPFVIIIIILVVGIWIITKLKFFKPLRKVLGL